MRRFALGLGLAMALVILVAQLVGIIIRHGWAGVAGMAFVLVTAGLVIWGSSEERDGS